MLMALLPSREAGASLGEAVTGTSLCLNIEHAGYVLPLYMEVRLMCLIFLSLILFFESSYLLGAERKVQGIVNHWWPLRCL